MPFCTRQNFNGFPSHWKFEKFVTKKPLLKLHRVLMIPKVALILLKIEYVIVRVMGIEELRTFLCASRYFRVQSYRKFENMVTKNSV